MFKVRHYYTKKAKTVYGIREKAKDGEHVFKIIVKIQFLFYEDGEWTWKDAEDYEPYSPLGDFKVGQKYQYLAGHNNYDTVEIKEIKGDFARVHSSIINDSIIVGLDELIREDFK